MLTAKDNLFFLKLYDYFCELCYLTGWPASSVWFVSFYTRRRYYKREATKKFIGHEGGMSSKI
jgi:hypothetical protein